MGSTITYHGYKGYPPKPVVIAREPFDFDAAADHLEPEAPDPVDQIVGGLTKSGDLQEQINALVRRVDDLEATVRRQQDVIRRQSKDLKSLKKKLGIPVKKPKAGERNILV